MLGKHIQWGVEAAPTRDLFPQDRVPDRGGLNQFERMSWSQRYARNAARRVAASPCPLQKPRDAFGRPDLDHALDGQEIDAEVETRGANDRFKRSVLQPLLHPVARLTRQRAVMDRKNSGPFRPEAKNMLIPEFRLRPRVGEDERRRRGFNLCDDRLNHFRPEVTRPRKALRRLRQKGIDAQIRPSTSAPCAASRESRSTRLASSRLPSVAERPRSRAQGENDEGERARAPSARRACCP
jgi:hypothetical protein